LRQRATTGDWPFQVKPLHPALGCEISGVTLAEAVESKLFDEVYEAFLDYELFLFRDVDLPPATQVASARMHCVGQCTLHSATGFRRGAPRARDAPLHGQRRSAVLGRDKWPRC
jgi:alpha-ketoglutarate-dependent taurine dioxygenase